MLLVSILGFLFLIVMLIISVYNYITVPILQKDLLYCFSGKDETNQKNNKSALLIPCRNEEDNIPLLIDNLKRQNPFEIDIYILNDSSTDSTRSVIIKNIQNLTNFYLLEGKPLKKGWVGKSWACHQLSEYVSMENYEFYFYIDADIFLEENAIYLVKHIMNQKSLDALSVFPTQVKITFGEKLVVPIMHWLLLSFLPLKLVYSTKYPSLSAANGQFIVFRQSSYKLMGGHKSVYNKVVEDIELFRFMKQNNFKVMTMIDRGLIGCRMYDGFSSAKKGFSKNIYPGSPLREYWFLLFVFIIISSTIILPIWLVINHFVIGFTYVLILILQRLVIALTIKSSILEAILFLPLQNFLYPYLMLYSYWKTKTNSIYWKDRNILTK